MSGHDLCSRPGSGQERATALRVRRFDAAGNEVALVDCRGTSWTAEALFREVLFPRRAEFGSPRLEIFGIVSQAEAALRADFWNPDGTRERVCANALRCIPTLVGTRRARVLTGLGEVEVAAPEPDVGMLELPEAQVRARQLGADEWIVDPGSPHRVNFVSDLHAPELVERGLDLSSGVTPLNATFVDSQSRPVRVRTFERGVGETASCGTAALAAFVARRLAGLCAMAARVRFVFHSGEELYVSSSSQGVLRLSGRCTPRRQCHELPAANAPAESIGRRPPASPVSAAAVR